MSKNTKIKLCSIIGNSINSGTTTSWHLIARWYLTPYTYRHQSNKVTFVNSYNYLEVMGGGVHTFWINDNISIPINGFYRHIFMSMYCLRTRTLLSPRPGRHQCLCNWYSQPSFCHWKVSYVLYKSVRDIHLDHLV